MKKTLLLLIIGVLILSACDALPFGESTQPTPPSDADVSEVGYLSKVIIELENAYGGNYRVTVGGVEFSCRTYEDYPDQLYCFGPELPVGVHTAIVYEGDSEEALFTLEIVVEGNVVVVTATPPPDTPTPLTPPTATPTPTSEVPDEVTVTQPESGVTATSVPPTAGGVPTATLSPDEAIKVYYFDLDEAGRFGCGEAMYWVKSSQRITDSIPDNISYALRFLFSYHQPYFGTLYNPYGASDNQFAVGRIEAIDEGVYAVYLTGTYERSEKDCDPTRLKDQLIQIATQFDNVRRAVIYLNGVRIEDAFQRK